jgi:hypothetical protein
MASHSGANKAKPANALAGAVYAASCVTASRTAGRMTDAGADASLAADPETAMGRLLLDALRAGLWGLAVGPLLAVVVVFGAMIFDPKCGVSDSGGCAMGMVTAPIAIALPSFALFFAFGLARGLWRRRPADPKAAIARLRNWGRED